MKKQGADATKAQETVFAMMEQDTTLDRLFAEALQIEREEGKEAAGVFMTDAFDKIATRAGADSSPFSLFDSLFDTTPGKWHKSNLYTVYDKTKHGYDTIRDALKLMKALEQGASVELQGMKLWQLGHVKYGAHAGIEAAGVSAELAAKAHTALGSVKDSALV